MHIENRLPVVMYSKPACVQCNATERWFKANKIQYRKVDVSEDEVALTYVKSLGYQGAPVVIVPMDWPNGGSHWYGFDTGNLEKLLG